jgi:uncharacterized protein
MRVGLLADTHDRVPAVAELVRRMQEGGAGLILHAGDYCAPFSLAPIRDAQLPMAGVFGRNDGDREGLRAFAGRGGVGSELYESPHSVELDGRRVLLVHELGEVSPRSLEAHEFVIHGCTHRVEVAERGAALVVNPGEACGWLHGTPTAAILDFGTRQVEVLRLEGPEWRT